MFSPRLLTHRHALRGRHHVHHCGTSSHHLQFTPLKALAESHNIQRCLCLVQLYHGTYITASCFLFTLLYLPIYTWEDNILSTFFRDLIKFVNVELLEPVLETWPTMRSLWTSADVNTRVFTFRLSWKSKWPSKPKTQTKPWDAARDYSGDLRRLNNRDSKDDWTILYTSDDSCQNNTDVNMTNCIGGCFWHTGAGKCLHFTGSWKNPSYRITFILKLLSYLYNI